MRLEHYVGDTQGGVAVDDALVLRQAVSSCNVDLIVVLVLADEVGEGEQGRGESREGGGRERERERAGRGGEQGGESREGRTESSNVREHTQATLIFTVVFLFASCRNCSTQLEKASLSPLFK